MDRKTAVTTWREVCGSDTVMAMPPTGRMLEEFARRIEAVMLRAERPAIKPVAQVVALDPEGPDGHGVNWLAGKRPKPGDLLYGGDAVARALAAKNEAETNALKAAQHLDEVLIVLRELVSLADMKTRLESLHEMGHGTDWDDWRRRNQKAWAAARIAALGA